MTEPNAGAGRADLRTMVIAACRELTRRGLTYGTSGNVSVRCDERRFFVSPPGMDYEVLQADDVPLMDLDGRWFGRRLPSSEWRFHRDIFNSRHDVGAIVHTHSPRATALACTGRGIPAFHYMVAVAGGSDIRCAPYHAFGTQELSDAVLAALKDRNACLLANHGVVATGADLPGAILLAGEVENLARSEEHTSELQSQSNLVCRLLLENKKSTCRRRKSWLPRVERKARSRPRLAPTS